MKFLQALCLLCFVLFSTSVFAQKEGIVWVENLNWQQVLEKAKAENKYIFLDCFATWCGPCYQMDKDVYTNKAVGDLVNEKFISVRVQMDKTLKDDAFVKAWYNDAAIIKRNFEISAFPTFIFLAPDGTPLHRAVGFHNASDFVVLTKDALDPFKQYYSLAKNYVPGMFDTSELKGLARALRSTGGKLPGNLAYEYVSRIPKGQLGYEDNISLMCEFSADSLMQLFVSNHLKTISKAQLSDSPNLLLIRYYFAVRDVRDLILDHLFKLRTWQLTKNLSLLTIFKNDSKAKSIADRYIGSLTKKEMYLKENISFLADFTTKSSDKGFNFFYRKSKQIDKIIGSKDFAISLIMDIIVEEEYKKLYREALNKEVDDIPWEKIADRIKHKYDSVIADRLNLHMKAAFYGQLAQKHDKYWSAYIDYYIQSVDKYELDTSVHNGFQDATILNNFVYGVIFFHSNNPDHIASGLRWMEGVIRRNPKSSNSIDTYANLLYKAGRKEEALQWQERAVDIAIEEGNKWKLPEMESSLAKMKRNEPTWIKEY